MGILIDTSPCLHVGRSVVEAGLRHDCHPCSHRPERTDDRMARRATLSAQTEELTRTVPMTPGGQFMIENIRGDIIIEAR